MVLFIYRMTDPNGERVSRTRFTQNKRLKDKDIFYHTWNNHKGARKFCARNLYRILF